MQLRIAVPSNDVMAGNDVIASSDITSVITQFVECAE